VKDSARKGLCTVWRATGYRVNSDRWKATYKIVKSANGFTKEG
jgi:hypothetical protein